jgi:tRNA pseudouridine32 synthase / 23S rRNA pseudouridine746 synthase
MSSRQEPISDTAPGRPRDFVYAPPDSPLDIVHVDEEILVLDKPSGLLTVAGKTEDLADCLEARANAAFPGARPVHRLDKDTSGLIVFARTPEALTHIGLQFEKRWTSKTYQALIWGQPSEESGLVDRPLKADWPNRPKQCISAEGGRPAQTEWRVIDRSNPVRLLLRPLTGRAHQLRIHMAFLGHPILGDNLYAHAAALMASARLCLHASTLSFVHPSKGTTLLFRSETPF